MRENSGDATPDAKEWTFKLRPGVTFHNGNAFTAQDVAFSLMRTQSETIDSPTKGVMEIIDRVEVVDDMTAKVVLKQTHALVSSRGARFMRSLSPPKAL